MKVYLETLGCQMNRLDSELLAAKLRLAGHELIDDRRTAEVVLYNTCSVRKHAEEKVYSRLGADGQRKANHRPRLIVGVLGCMAQREGEALTRRFPQVDIVCSPGRLGELPDLIARVTAGGKAVALDPDRGSGGPVGAADGEGVRDLFLPETPAEPQTPPTQDKVSDPSSVHDSPADFDSMDLARDVHRPGATGQAYVRVAEGCDNFCTYCIVPFVRGPERSRRPARIVEEVHRLTEAGCTEVTLLGQTVNRYRYAAGGQTVRFSDLLGRVAAVAGLRRLRFVTSHPLDFTDDILQAMRDLPNVCEYIHIPPQSGSDAVLKRMNRKYTRGQYDELVDRARAIVPGVVLAGDFIVGFPGETDADHAASAELIRRSGFKNSYVFKYSPRPGTAAARRFPDDVPTDIKRRRNNDLLAVQQEVGLAHHRGYIGRTVEVLVEGPSVRADKQAVPATGQSTQLVGRTRGDHIVHFLAPPSLTGQYIQVRITDATALAMLGEAGGADGR